MLSTRETTANAQIGSPAVSIVVPLHNAESYASTLVASLKAQTFREFEVILVDDGSTDGTADALERETVGDARFKIISQEAAGPGVARNAGIAHARGAYIGFVDADDEINAHMVERAYGLARKTKADIVIWQARHHNMKTGATYPSPDRWNPREYPSVFDPHEHADNLFGSFRNWPWDKLFRREFLADNGIQFPALYRTEDLAFTCSALASARRIALLDKRLYTYRVGGSSSSTQTLDQHPYDFIESCKLLRAYLKSHELMDTYEKTYVQWCTLCVHVNMLGLQTPDAFLGVYRALKEGGLDDMGLTAEAVSDDADGENGAAADAAHEDAINVAAARTVEIIRHCEPDEGAFLILRAEANRIEALRARVSGIAQSRTYRAAKTLARPLLALSRPTGRS